MRTCQLLCNETNFEPAFLRNKLLENGWTEDQLRGRSVTRLYRGAYALDASTYLNRARAALLLAGEGARLCHQTVLILAGLRVPEEADHETIHVLVDASNRGARRKGIRAHREKPHHHDWTVLGLPAIHPVDCWIQMSSQHHVTDLVVVADGLMSRRNPITTLPEMLARVEQWNGYRGIRRARTALELAMPGTDSARETIVRLKLTKAGLPCPIINWEVDARNTCFYLDMAYPELKIAIEYDGAIHVSSRNQMESDRSRRRWLEDHGWRVITVTATDLKHKDWIHSIRLALQSRGWTPC